MRTKRSVTIRNELGIHARPAAEFVRRANSFTSEIWVVFNGRRYSGTSLVDLMRANLGFGATATLEAHGKDAEEAVEKLVSLLENIRDCP